MKKRMKENKINILGFVVLLITFGLWVSDYVEDTLKTQVSEPKTVKTIKTTKETNKSVPQAEQLRVKKVKDSSELSENGYADYDAMARPTIEEIQEAQQHVNELHDLYVGTIEVPAIGLQMNILEGTTYERMLYAATTILPHSKMGQGNYVLASHNVGIEGKMFSSLHQIKEGDLIHLTDKSGKEYTYKTTKLQVVNYKDTSLMETPKEQAIITLSTCESVENTTNRVIVQGTLTEK